MPVAMDSAQTAAARVEVNNLPGYRNATVRIVGQVIENNNGATVVLATPQGNVTIQRLPDSEYSDYMEVIGRVNSNNTVEEYSSTCFGPNFDLKLYSEAVGLSLQYSNIF